MTTGHRYVCVCLLLAIGILPAAHAEGIVDTHSHILNEGRSTDFAASIAAAIGRMDAHGIRAAIVMPPPMPPDHRGLYDLDDYAGAAAAHPQRILLAGGGGTLNPMIHSVAADAVTDEIRNRFRERTEALVRAGAVFFGEIIGSNFFHGVEGAASRRPVEGSLGVYGTVLADLPRELAEAIMHGNAERVYGIARTQQR